MLTEKIEAIGRAPWAALDTLARGIWIDHTAGRIGDAEAQALAEAVEARRRALRKPTQGPFMPRVVVVREGAGRAPAGNVRRAWRYCVPALPFRAPIRRLPSLPPPWRGSASARAWMRARPPPSSPWR